MWPGHHVKGVNDYPESNRKSWGTSLGTGMGKIRVLGMGQSCGMGGRCHWSLVTLPPAGLDSFMLSTRAMALTPGAPVVRGCPQSVADI